MILGQINTFRQAVIQISVYADSGQTNDYSATIDTGFSGFLTLAPGVIAALNLPFVEMR